MTSNSTGSGLYCFYCGVDNTAILRCVQCKSVWYCSREHQKQHWGIHKNFCVQRKPKKELVPDLTKNFNKISYTHKLGRDYENTNIPPYSNSQINKSEAPFPSTAPNYMEQFGPNSLSANYSALMSANEEFLNIPMHQQYSKTNNFYPAETVPYRASTSDNFSGNLYTSTSKQDFSPNNSPHSSIYKPFSSSPANYSLATNLFASENSILGSDDALTDLLSDDSQTAGVIDFGDAASLYLDTANLLNNSEFTFEERKPTQPEFLSSNINKSPQISSETSLHNSVQSNYENDLSNQALHIRNELYQRGYCIVDNFLDQECARGVMANVNMALESGAMKAGQVVKGNHNEDIRGDLVMWLSGQEEQYQYITYLMLVVDQLVAALSKLIDAYVIKGRTPAMVACYPGRGSRYRHHIDNSQKDGRIITCLYYLNDPWDCEKDGGMLRLYPMGNRIDIEPIFNRLLLFWSDKRTPHEVLPSFRRRFAITLWYFDAAEREVVKQAYFAKLRSQFASSGQDEIQANRPDITDI